MSNIKLNKTQTKTQAITSYTGFHSSRRILQSKGYTEIVDYKLTTQDCKYFSKDNIIASIQRLSFNHYVITFDTGLRINNN